MANASSTDRTVRDVTINLRANRRQRTLIDRAAQSLGKNRSDFMLDASCREAESVLLDHRFFALDDAAFEEFRARLDAPPTVDPGLVRLLAEKAPWEQ